MSRRLLSDGLLRGRARGTAIHAITLPRSTGRSRKSCVHSRYWRCIAHLQVRKLQVAATRRSQLPPSGVRVCGVAPSAACRCSLGSNADAHLLRPVDVPQCVSCTIRSRHHPVSCLGRIPGTQFIGVRPFAGCGTGGGGCATGGRARHVWAHIGGFGGVERKRLRFVARVVCRRAQCSGNASTVAACVAAGLHLGATRDARGESHCNGRQ